MKKILVWLSWWVDSAIAAYLLLQQGYEVVWWFMKNYVDEENANCSTYQDAQEAIRVAKFLWIKLLSFDFRKEYDTRIINYIYEWYKQWITPNPDLLCNNLIKFDVFLKKALALWFDGIATGHYAQKGKEGKYHTLLRGIDPTKDQSYFLAGLTQEQLAYALFPIGDLTKKEVRVLAKKIGLPNAERKDSQWLCFIWNVPIRNFLMKKLKKKEWNILDTDGKKLWTHEWAYFYTIGQRHGLNLPPDRYVTRIDVKKNIVYVGKKSEESLNPKLVHAAQWHRIGKIYPLPLAVTAKIRYRQEPAKATLSYEDKKTNAVLFTFKDPVRAVAPGQHTVAYKGDICLGHGTII